MLLEILQKFKYFCTCRETFDYFCICGNCYRKQNVDKMSGFVLRKLLILKYFCTCIETFDYEIFVEIVTETGCRCENDCRVLCWKKLFPCFWKKSIFFKNSCIVMLQNSPNYTLREKLLILKYFCICRKCNRIAGFCVEKNSAPASEKKLFFKNSKFYRNVTETHQNP